MSAKKAKAGKPKPGAKQARKTEPKPGAVNANSEGAAAVELAPEPKKAKGELDPAEWDFFGIPPEELPACFLWEYARESEWLRNLRKRCLAFWRGGSNKASDPALDSDLRIVQGAMPYESEVFLSGFFFEHDHAEKSQSEDPKAPHYRHPQAPAITGSFPASWQSLKQAERQHRAHIRSDVETIPLAPFGRGYDFHCDLIRDHSKRERERQIADGGHAKNVPSSVRWEGGKEEGVFCIEWGSFTNKAIADYFREWVKAKRPDSIPEPRKNGDKTEDRRAWLQWLGAMRALSHSTFKHPWFPKELRQLGERRVYDMRKKAREKFQDAFCFLPAPIEPRSFRTSVNVSPSER